MPRVQEVHDTALTLRRLGVFGAEITGLDLRHPLDDQTVETLQGLFAEHSVLVFPDQPLDDDQQVAFSRIFGELEQTSFGIASTNPYIYEMSNVDDDGAVLPVDAKKRVFLSVNARWHTDSSFRPIPAKASLLSAREVPRTGGQTAFASMRVGYETLAEPMRRRIEGLQCVHDVSYTYSLFSDTGVTGDEIETVPPATHPIIRTHPDTGTKNLFVSGHIERIVGMPVEVGRALAQELIAWCTRPEMVYTHSWRAGDLVMWDNRCALHRAVDIPVTERRILHRTTVAGEGPVV